MTIKNSKDTQNASFQVTLAFLAAAVSAKWVKWTGPIAGGEPADRYPAGVSPQACPNFPNCANPSLAAQPYTPVSQTKWTNTQAQNQWNTQPKYQSQPQWNSQPQPKYQPQPQWNSQPQQQWNAQPQQQQWNAQPQWNNQQQQQSQWNSQPQPQSQWNAPNQYNVNYNAPTRPIYENTNSVFPEPSKIPAGVDPSSCPNYPFCK